MDKEELTLKVGDSGNITATVDPTNATNKNVTWSSSDTEVATVANGKVTAVAAGTAAITATSNNGKTATTTVTVVAENTVAMIGTVYYETLDAALAAAVDGDTVTLLNDITLDSTLLIDKAVTIDGNGYSVNQAIYITKDEVTIKNLTGTIVPREEHKISGIGGQSAFVVSADKVVLDNITVDGKSEANSAAVRGLLDAQFEVINSNISNVQTGIFAHHGNTAPEAGQNVLIVTGNTFTNVWAGIGGTEKTNLTATGNTFVSIQDNGEGIGLGNGVVVIGADTEDDVNYLETNNTFNYSEGNKVVDYRSAVANISQGKYYDTVQAAIDDAAAGDEIIVGDGDYKEELTINKAITLKSLNGSESTKIAGTITIVPLDDEKLQDVTVEGFTVTAPTGYKAYPVIHMNNLENVNILNNSVVADDTAYGAIGTQDGPAKVTGKISGNTVTGMIMVGTDGAVEVSNNNVTLTTASTEGICFYPVGPAAEITVTGNTVGQVTGDNVHIKVNEKPLSVNGKTNEVDMLAAITAGNAGATAQLSWVKTVGATGADFTTIQDAVNGVNGGDTILVKAGTYTADNTNPITINKKVTLMGDNALINVSTGNQPIQVNADGTVIQGFMITKTDKAHQDIIYINANDVTIIDNVISGQYEFGDAQVDRAILGVSGKTGIQIVGNKISDLRQPAYFNGGNTGDVIDNYVTNTRGWVVCGDSKMSFTGNTFGTNAVDIAIIPNDNVINNYGTTPQEIIEISDSNNGAYVENQLSKISAKDGKQVLADGLTYDAASDTYEISNANGLQYLAKAINTDGTYSGATVKLTQDIKLEGIEWTPIYANGYTGPGNNATLTIDGNGHTISDLSKPLIGRVWSAIKVNIKNLTISGSTIVVDEEDLEGNVGVGAFIGSTDAFDINLENCHLIGSTVKGGHWTGGLVGYLTGSDTNMGKMNILNSSVINSTINGKGSAGSLLGHATGSALANIDITNATVTGNTVTSTGASSEKAGSVMGTVGAGTVKVNNLNESNNTVKSNETIIIDRIYGRLAGGSLVID